MKPYSFKFRALLALVAASLAWQPVYGQRFSLPQGAEKLLSVGMKGPKLDLKTGGLESGGISTLPNFDKLRPAKNPDGTCKNPGFERPDFKDSLKPDLNIKHNLPPIFEDLTACDMPLYKQCTEALVTALNNPAQALVGFDPRRDDEIPIGGTPSYTEDDVRKIRSVLGSWFVIQEGGLLQRDPLNPTRKRTREEIELDQILDVNLPAQRWILSAQDIATVSSIHLKLSSELAAATEAYDAAGAFGSAQAAVLFAKVNPVGAEGLSCLLGFKKPKAERPVDLLKGRKIIGYASGIVYGEINDPTRMEPITGTIIAAALGLVGVLVTVYAYVKIEREKMANDSREKQKDRDHASSEAEKARDFEREKEGMPPRKVEPANTAPKVPTPDSKLKPIVSPENPKEDIFKKPEDKDFNSVPNAHTVEDDYTCKLNLDKSKLDQTWSSPSEPDPYAKVKLPDLKKGYYDYGNPADRLDFKIAKVLSLEEFRKGNQEKLRNRECEVLDFAQP